LSLAALALSAFVWFQFSTTSSTSKLEVTKLQYNTKAIQKNLDGMQGGLKENSDAIQRLTEHTAGEQETWVLLEVEHLMQLANLNLNFTRNIPISINLLETADKRMHALHDAKLLEVRKIIAKNIQDLKAVAIPDLEGLLARLAALEDKVPSLNLISPGHESVNQKKKDKSSEEQEKNKSKQAAWKKALNESWKTMEKIVVIRHHDDFITPLLNPEQHFYLDQNLRLLFSQAQWAVLNSKPSIFKSSMQQATTLIKRFFEPKDAKTQAMLKSIAKLKESNIKPKIPDISNSLNALHARMKRS